MPPLFSVSYTSQGSPAGIATTLRDPPQRSASARCVDLPVHRPAQGALRGLADLPGPVRLRHQDRPGHRATPHYGALPTGAFEGSSPLARGLPPSTCPYDGPAGSSPLTRGLRVSRQRARTSRPDHPRSRGVYVPNRPAAGAVVGSSPLARGLPYDQLRRLTAVRIIPARAGFTIVVVVGEFVAKDHPRSRGVYDGSRRVATFAHGSSPLARGLRASGNPAWRVTGIIPARAGFTTPARA